MSRRPFVVDVVALRRRHGQRERVEARGRLEGLVVTEAAVPEDAEVSVDVVLESVEGGIVARGVVRAPWVGECRRCLRALQGEEEAEVEGVFVPVADAVEGDTWPIEHHQIDLEGMVREAAALELPLAPLCRPDCAGLCPTCGADLNDGPCPCRAAMTDARWEALDQLREGRADAEGL